MKKHASAFLRFAIAAILMNGPAALISSSAFAQSTFTPPPSSAPGNREAGGTRSDTCAATTNTSTLTALIPETNLGLTTKDFPSFAAYLPANNAQWVEFRLYEEETQEKVFAGQLQVPQSSDPNATYRNQPVVVSVTLPQDGSVAPLQAGKRYFWTVMMVCNGEDRAEDVVVTGVVERVNQSYLNGLDPTVRQKLSTVNTASAQEKLSIYSAAGIWQDLVSELITLRLANPATYQSEWNSLLSGQGLGAIASAPIFRSQMQPL